MRNTLIVYYSQTGQSKRIAELLGRMLNADLAEIQTVRTYNDDMWKADEEAKQELKEGRLPELKGKLPDITPYKTVIIGGPVWGQTLSNPVLSFMRQTDFSSRGLAPMSPDLFPGPGPNVLYIKKPERISPRH